MLVGAVVVHHQMDVQVLGDGRLDLAQEAQEFLVPVAGLALGDHLASYHIQGYEKSGCAVADVVMRYPLHVAQPHVQQRLSAVQRLDLGLSRRRIVESPFPAGSGTGRRCRGPSPQ